VWWWSNRSGIWLLLVFGDVVKAPYGLLIAAIRLTLGIHCTLAAECAKIRPNQAGDASPNC